MIVAAALCPWPPLLARPLTGEEPVLGELRAACAAAVARLLAAGPDLVVVTGPAVRTAQLDATAPPGLAVFAPALAEDRGHARISGRAPGSGLGEGSWLAEVAPSVALGTLLLDQAGYAGPRLLQAVSETEAPQACATLGAALAGQAPRTGLLVMGDGSARRGPGAPGHLDGRAHAFDAAAERAFRDGDAAALLAISPELAAELLATGRPAWQVLAGAFGERMPAARVMYRDDPFGVAYLVAVLTT